MPELSPLNRLGILLLAAGLILAVGALVQYLQSRNEARDTTSSSHPHPSGETRRHTAIRMAAVAVILASMGLVLIVT